MKKTILITLLLFVTISASAYQWKNESGNDLKVTMDFANGGIVGSGASFNTSTGLGGSTIPFNATGQKYNIHQGWPYVIWSDTVIIAIVGNESTAYFSCTYNFVFFQVAEIICTSLDNFTSWDFSVVEVESGNSTTIYGSNIDSAKLLAGLKEGYTYNVSVNASAPLVRRNYIIQGGDTDLLDQFFGLLLFGAAFVAVLILIAFMHLFKNDRGTPMVYGIIASVISYITAAIIFGGFDVIQGITLIIDVNYYFGFLMVGMGIYTTSVSYTFYQDIKEENVPDYYR